MVTKFDYSKLIGRIFEKEYTFETFAEIVEISLYTLSLKLSNKANFKQGEIDKICKALDICINEVGVYFFTPKV